MPAEAPAAETELTDELQAMLDEKNTELDTRENLAPTPKSQKDKANMTLQEMLDECPIYFDGINRNDQQALQIRYLTIQRDLLRGSLQLTQPYYDIAQRQTLQAEKTPQAIESSLDQALKIIKTHKTAIALTGLGVLATGGLLAYPFIHRIGSTLIDISGRVLQALRTPTPALAVSPTELPPTLTPTPDLDPTLTNTPFPSPTLTFEPTTAPEKLADKPPFFIENITQYNPETFAKYQEVTVNPGSVIYLLSDGRSFTQVIDSNSVTLPEGTTIVACATFNETLGQPRFAVVDHAIGNTVQLTKDKKTGAVGVHITDEYNNKTVVKDWMRKGNLSPEMLDWNEYLSDDDLYTLKSLEHSGTGIVTKINVPTPTPTQQ